MPEFEEITDIIEEAPKKFSKFAKKHKIFPIALAVAGACGLYVLYRNKNTQTTATETYAYIPTGYDGYPEMSESMLNDYASVENMNSAFYDEVMSDISQTVEDMQIRNDNYISDMVTQFDSERLKYDETISYLEEQRQKEAVINQMQNNSTLWGLTDNKSYKEQLHAENEKLASSIGATFDNSTGNWYLNGEKLYTTVLENKTTTDRNTNPQSTGDSTKVSYSENVNYQAEIIKAIQSGASGSTINSLNEQRNAKIQATGGSSAKVSYDKNTDYAALINQAKSSGASQQVIDNLTAQREAKIKGENLNNDGTKK